MKAKTIVVFVLVIVSLAMSGCSSIRSHRNLDQPTGSVLTTGVGGTVFRLNKTGDLPNVFGRRDIWGGKIDKGFAEMKLADIEGAILVLEVTDVNKSSSETVMDRYKPFDSLQNSARAFSGTGRGVAIDVDVDVNNTVVIGNQEQAKPHIIRFDTAKQRDIVISGIRVNFSDIQPFNVQYTLEDIRP